MILLGALIVMPLAIHADDWPHVYSLEDEDPVARAVWAAYVDRLNAGDAEGAVDYFVPELRDTQLELYQILGDKLKTIALTWSDLAEPKLYGPFISYKFINTSSSQLFSVTFLKMRDGQWLIYSL